MFAVEVHDADGVAIDVGFAQFGSIDVARGFAVGVARWQIASGEHEGQIHISSDDRRIEGATFEFWARAEFPHGREA